MPLPRTTTSLTGLQLEEKFCSIASQLDGDIASRQTATARLANSAAARNEQAPDWSMAPKIFDRSQVALLKNASETMLGIMEAAMRAFTNDEQIRKFFGIAKEDEPLVLAAAQDSFHIPLARVDIFLNEATGQYWFCETNTDGSAGFTATDLITEAIQSSATCHQIEREGQALRAAHLRDSWIATMKRLYARWTHSTGRAEHEAKPTIALVDYLESIELGEAEDFVTRLNAAGFDAHLTDIRKLEIETRNGKPSLADNHGAIDCVWKRAVTGEILRKREPGARALVQASNENLACVIGSFRSWPVATKTFFALLHNPLAKSFLSSEQLAFVEAHVPKTYLVRSDADARRFKDRARFIIKPTDGYNAIGVIAGSEVSDTQWREALSHATNTPLVVQEYAPQYATPIIPGKLDSKHDALTFPQANNMLGLFLFDGEFSGVFPRCGYGAVIGEHQGRFEQGCLYI